MKSTTQPTTVETFAMALGGGLVLLGTIVMGVLETLLGTPNAVPITNDAGVVVAGTTFDPQLRAAIVLAGLLVFGLFAGYRVLAAPDEGTETRRSSVEQIAD